MTSSPGIFARGPWAPAQVRADWREDMYEPPDEATAAADAAITALARARLAEPRRPRRAPRRRTARRTASCRCRCSRSAGRCAWSTATPPQSMAALCVTRAHDGRWLAGRRAAWLSTWAGAGPSAPAARSTSASPPPTRSTRELHEEWRLAADRVRGRGAGPPAPPAGHVRRPGVARPRGPRRPRHGRRARRVRVVARRRSTTGPPRPTRRCATWPGCSRPPSADARADPAAA